MMGSHIVVVEVSSDFQTTITDRPERQHRDIEVEQVRIVSVDDVKRTVVEVCDKLL